MIIMSSKNSNPREMSLICRIRIYLSHLDCRYSERVIIISLSITKFFVPCIIIYVYIYIIIYFNNSRINCWVCFGSTDDDKDAEWVQPCKCRGTTKWVHQTCLQRWIDEKQKGNSSAAVSCPACNEEYILVFPPFGKHILYLFLKYVL